MMDINKMKKRHLLQVFELITSKGVKSEGVYQYQDITASHDFDGYTCWLAFKDLTVTLLFHGAYDLDYDNEETLKIFFKKVAKLLDD
ncbi:DUF3081 family protein [Psychromonas sp. GE-S-Ul-11]|uniref:DUF3081 family protein n=2 Tax=Psychromonas TaxID=67572 RepID=UPI00390CB13D